MTYYKIPVNLNEGAGGKYIHLYYTKTSRKDQGIGYLDIVRNCCFSSDWGHATTSSGWNRNALNFSNGKWHDLNDGAGGYYLYLQSLAAAAMVGRVITDIAVVSSSKSMGSYSGWHLINYDLNKGAGGKWIYLCYNYVSWNSAY